MLIEFKMNNDRKGRVKKFLTLNFDGCHLIIIKTDLSNKLAILYKTVFIAKMEDCINSMVCIELNKDPNKTTYRKTQARIRDGMCT